MSEKRNKTSRFLGGRLSDRLYIAHQGYSERYIGNTAPSFRAAAEMDFYGIETDVRETADGVFVCNHNESAKFADGGEKTISASTYAELSEKPLRNNKTSDDTYICLFEEYLRICKSGGKIAVIELKETFSTEKLLQILGIIDEQYDRTKVSVITFYMETLLRIRQLDPSVEIQYLSSTVNDPAFERCLAEGIPIDVRQIVLTKRLTTEFHKHGLKVNVWTVNKKSDRWIVRFKQANYVTSNLFCGS